LNTSRSCFTSVIAVTLLLATSAPCPAQTASNAHTKFDVVVDMQSSFVGKISFDGALITDIDAVAACLTRIQTETTSTVVNWTLVENPSPAVSNTSVSIPIVTPYAIHDFTAPYSAADQDLGRHMEKTIGELSLACRSGDH
jgi:hypothetical protein